MAYIQDRQASVGELLSGTFIEIAGIKKELALYFGVFLIAGLAADFIEPLRGVIGAVSFFGYFAGQYYLYRAVLRRTGVICDPAFKVFSLLFMAVLLILPIMFGLQFFVIPGILLASKWIMAPAYLVAEELNVFDAIGSSWRASGGSTLALSATFTMICIGWMVIFGLGDSLLGDSNGTALLASAGASKTSLSTIGWLLFHMLPIMLMGLSVSAYRALSDAENDYVSVFE